MKEDTYSAGCRKKYASGEEQKNPHVRKISKAASARIRARCTSGRAEEAWGKCSAGNAQPMFTPGSSKRKQDRRGKSFEAKEFYPHSKILLSGEKEKSVHRSRHKKNKTAQKKQQK